MSPDAVAVMTTTVTWKFINQDRRQSADISTLFLDRQLAALAAC